MAVTATAVSFRRGTSVEHTRFTGGVPGEITVDMTDSTLWVHLGDGRIGTPLARADTSNIDTTNLVDPSIHDGVLSGSGNKPLCYNDLTNVLLNDIEIVQNNLEPLGYAYKDTRNINTVDLALATFHPGDPLHPYPNINIPSDETQLAEWRQNHNKPLAFWDASNISTVGLAERSSDDIILFGEPLAYDNLTNVDVDFIINKIDTEVTDYETHGYYAKTDFSNIDTVKLATGTGQPGEHRGKNLSYTDLSNIVTIANANTVHNAGVQVTSLMTNDLNPTSASQYPSTQAVKDAFDALDKIPELPALNDESNVDLKGNFPYKYKATMTNAGRGYNPAIDLKLNNAIESIIRINQVGNDGEILDYTLRNQYGIDSNSGITGTYTATALSNIEWYTSSTTITNIQIVISQLESQIGTSSYRNLIFIYNGSNWTLNNTIVDLTTYGISYNDFPGPIVNDTIEIDYYPINYGITTNAVFTISIEETGQTKIQWNNDNSDPQIKDIQMDEDTGSITISISKIPRTTEIKNVLTNKIIGGYWTRLHTVMTFYPDDSEDTLANAWIIKVS